ncbi:gephyrin-like molybdotransferase Glp [Halobacillus sp. A5]|uniref:molybdopterin molybdotransferase MoeA n=1 Tax=Halobacillus sp. A5 TaxID=2880263 RepID=UPI0020A6D1CF|nr:gephyrin-like molybdotransferase Glp [Halobacillus sp. A5]MCP3026321.1 molybdopterin molybdotransferase MoeA [Halobacillus sp. A5]
MNLHRKPIPVSEAVERVMNCSTSLKSEKINLNKCDQRILAEDIVATHAIPPFDKSPYDGFAIKAEDTINAGKDRPKTFKVVDEIGAGHRASRVLQTGEAVRIMTGAEIPEGANCVAMFEICQTFEKDGAPYITIKRRMESGQNIIIEASETRQGTLLVEKGTLINPGVKALLATFGYDKIEVNKKPVVGVFATGTELLDVDQPLEPGKIRNSNAYMVLSQINRSGAEARYYGKLADEFDPCFNAITAALEEVDVLITTGGVSVGDYDLMPAIYEKLGAEVLFNKIAMRPGSVTTVAKAGDRLLFGLSGNPSACYVGFELYTYPYLQKLMQNQTPYHPVVTAALGEDFGKPNPFTRFIRGYVSYEKGKVVVYPAGMDKSAVVTSLAHTNVFIVLKGGTRGYKKGEEVQAVLIEDQKGNEAFQLNG